MKIKYLLLIFILALVSGCSDNVELGEVVVAEPMIEENKIAVPDPNKPADKVFSLNAKNFRFYINGKESPNLRVKRGDKVKINLVSEQGFHDFVVDEFSVATKKINSGATDSIEFIAKEKGTFEYYCSVGSHREMGMKGNLIVE